MQKIASSLFALALLVPLQGCVEPTTPEDYAGTWNGIFTFDTSYDDPAFDSREGSSVRMGSVSIEAGTDSDIILTEENGCALPGTIQSDGGFTLETTTCTPPNDATSNLIITGDGFLKGDGSLQLNLETNFNRQEDGMSVSGQYKTDFLGSRE